MEASLIKIYYFARCREDVGTGEESIPLDQPEPLSTVLERLCELHPGLRRGLSYTRVAINQSLQMETPL